MGIKNTLYLRLSGIFMLILLLLAIVYVMITTYSAQEYFQERSQKLHENLAEQIMKEVEPFMYNGVPIPEKIDEIMHYMMAINPSIEVYILDVDGKILEYAAPYGEVKLENVSLLPIEDFLSGERKQLCKGDDPKNPSLKKIFSVAPHRNDMTQEVDGYVYVILAGQEHQSATDVLFGSFIMKVGLRSFVLSLFGAFAIGLFILWLLTRNLREIIRKVKQFSDGNYDARISLNNAGELSILANTYNQMADTIEANINELKSTEKLRRELTANISHDLRTPLAVIHGYMETMIMKEEDGTLVPEDRKKYMEIVLKNTVRLKKLVSELFELSKLEAKQVKPKIEPFFLQELVMDSYNKYKVLADKKHVELEAKIEDNLPLVEADLSMIERVLQNLLDNALKFTEEGDKIEIAIKNVEGKVQVEVADSGVGIAEKEQAQIFDRFRKYQSTTHNKDGMGLGLAIVKKMLELHNTDIKLSSKLNKGTTFSFKLAAHT